VLPPREFPIHIREEHRAAESGNAIMFASSSLARLRLPGPSLGDGFFQNINESEPVAKRNVKSIFDSLTDEILLKSVHPAAASKWQNLCVLSASLQDAWWRRC
jgi:hypothetical protein